jgi:Fe-S-cluster containining protein
LDGAGTSLARAWLDAARDPRVAAELEAVYQMIADQIEARGPACWASGRCCNFEKTGHRLYVTGLEAAYTVARVERPPAGSDIAAALDRGDCPFLSANLCGVHTVKPLGCRVYFCDRSAQDWQKDLSECALDLVRRINERHEIPYRYGEWRSMLSHFAV